ncbi:MAG: HAD hydrolase-like protein [Candidatus Paceibacterota bacterium]|jgi:FMN phosphatase YigB (HAD superfamily)
MKDFNEIKIIGFDLDQTLYPKSPEIDDAIQTYIYDQIAKNFKMDKETARKKFDGLYKKGKGLSGSKSLVVLGFPIERAGEIIQEALENAPIAKFLKPNKKVLDLLNNLKTKYKFIDLITGSNKSNATIKLEKLEIPKQTFSNVITADNGSKSDLSAFNLWFSFYSDYKTENFLYIGDRVSSDYEQPRKLGIQSILVNLKTPDSNVECLQLNNLLDIEKYLL